MHNNHDQIDEEKEANGDDEEEEEKQYTHITHAYNWAIIRVAFGI